MSENIEKSRYLFEEKPIEEKPSDLTENQMWTKTDDIVGLRPVEPIYCPICHAKEPSVKVEMTMRRSRIHMVADIRIANPSDGNRPYAFDIAYKCPRCDFYCVFGVPTDIQYAHKILELRGSKVDYVLPELAWEEDERIKTRMAKWGYW